MHFLHIGTAATWLAAGIAQAYLLVHETTPPRPEAQIQRMFDMVACDTTRPVAYGTRQNLIGRIASALTIWNNSRVTRNALSKLSDRELDDIGLSRADIYSVSGGR